MTFLLRLVLLAAGLLLAASLAVVASLMLAFWGLRAAWAMLTGKPVSPFVIRVHPRDGFGRMYRAAEQAGGPRRTEKPGRSAGDVTDVQVKR